MRHEFERGLLKEILIHKKLTHMKARFSIYLMVIVLFVTGCSPSTYVTGTWKSPTPPVSHYSSILVAALTSNTIVKATLEKDLSSEITKTVSAVKSIDEFPPDISGSDSNKLNIMQGAQRKNLEAVLTVSILSKETESRYVPNRNPYSPLAFDYYQNFGGYYNYWYPSFYGPDYYQQDKVYYIETNLYDAKTEKLVWSAQSKTYSPDELNNFSKEFAVVIVNKMKADGVLKQ
jgi:hypothetical protein